MKIALKLKSWTLAAALLTSVLSGQTALGGSMAIYNDNCVTFKSIGSNWDWVQVHIYSKNDTYKCTIVDHEQVDKGSTVTVDLISHIINGTEQCMYYNEALGTTLGKNDVSGSEDSNVTCQQDLVGFCECVKVGTFIPN